MNYKVKILNLYARCDKLREDIAKLGLSININDIDEKKALNILNQLQVPGKISMNESKSNTARDLLKRVMISTEKMLKDTGVSSYKELLEKR